MIDDVQWFVGIDWATQSHRVCLLDVDGQHVSERDFAHGGAGLTEMRDWLLEKTKAAPGQIAWMKARESGSYGRTAALISTMPATSGWRAASQHVSVPPMESPAMTMRFKTSGNGIR